MFENNFEKGLLQRFTRSLWGSVSCLGSRSTRSCGGRRNAFNWPQRRGEFLLLKTLKTIVPFREWNDVFFCSASKREAKAASQ